MTLTPTTCRTCGTSHQGSPFGCPRTDAPLFDVITDPAQLDRLVSVLAHASMEIESEALALDRFDLRTHRHPCLASMIYGVCAQDYHAMADDTAALLAEALGALEVRA